MKKIIAIALVGLVFLFVGCSNGNDDDDSKFDEDNHRELVFGDRVQNEDGEWEIIPFIPADPH